MESCLICIEMMKYLVHTTAQLTVLLSLSMYQHPLLLFVNNTQCNLYPYLISCSPTFSFFLSQNRSSPTNWTSLHQLAPAAWSCIVFSHHAHLFFHYFVFLPLRMIVFHMQLVPPSNRRVFFFFNLPLLLVGLPVFKPFFFSFIGLRNKALLQSTGVHRCTTQTHTHKTHSCTLVRSRAHTQHADAHV